MTNTLSFSPPPLPIRTYWTSNYEPTNSEPAFYPEMHVSSASNTPSHSPTLSNKSFRHKFLSSIDISQRQYSRTSPPTLNARSLPSIGDPSNPLPLDSPPQLHCRDLTQLRPNQVHLPPLEFSSRNDLRQLPATINGWDYNLLSGKRGFMFGGERKTGDGSRLFQEKGSMRDERRKRNREVMESDSYKEDGVALEGLPDYIFRGHIQTSPASSPEQVGKSQSRIPSWNSTLASKAQPPSIINPVDRSVFSSPASNLPSLASKRVKPQGKVTFVSPATSPKPSKPNLVPSTTSSGMPTSQLPSVAIQSPTPTSTRQHYRLARAPVPYPATPVHFNFGPVFKNPPKPRAQFHKLKGSQDLYTSRWVRGEGEAREKWCSLCPEGYDSDSGEAVRYYWFPVKVRIKLSSLVDEEIQGLSR